MKHYTEPFLELLRQSDCDVLTLSDSELSDPTGDDIFG